MREMIKKIDPAAGTVAVCFSFFIGLVLLAAAQ